jgi:hypothetical protein
MSRRITMLIAVVCLALLFGLPGLALDPSGFGSNLLAEMVGVVVGIGAAVLVVERLIDRDRRERWQLVEEQTIANLRLALVKGALQLYQHLPKPRPMEADPLMNRAVGKLGDALEKLSSLLRADESMDLSPDSLRRVLDNIAPQLDFVRNGVMQRLLTVGPDPELITLLTKLEATFESLDLAAWLAEHFGSRPGDTTQRMAELADSTKDVVMYLDSRGKASPARR